MISEINSEMKQVKDSADEALKDLQRTSDQELKNHIKNFSDSVIALSIKQTQINAHHKQQTDDLISRIDDINDKVDCLPDMPDPEYPEYDDEPERKHARDSKSAARLAKSGSDNAAKPTKKAAGLYDFLNTYTYTLLYTHADIHTPRIRILIPY